MGHLETLLSGFSLQSRKGGRLGETMASPPLGGGSSASEHADARGEGARRGTCFPSICLQSLSFHLSFATAGEESGRAARNRASWPPCFFGVSVPLSRCYAAAAAEPAKTPTSRGCRGTMLLLSQAKHGDFFFFSLFFANCLLLFMSVTEAMWRSAAFFSPASPKSVTPCHTRLEKLYLARSVSLSRM